MTAIELLKQASEHRKLKQYKAAINIYKPLWDQDPMQFGEWDAWAYGFSLKEMKLYDEALDISRKAYPRFKTSKFIISLYAQCIFYTQFTNTSKSNIATQRKALQAMYKLSPPHEAYSLTSEASFRFCKKLMDQQNIPWGEVQEWLVQMEPDLLNKEAYQMSLPDGRKIEVASQQEKWYSYMIRVKAAIASPEEQLKIIKEALTKNIKWHYNNDIWIKRKKAFAYKELGSLKQAENLLRNILRKKKDWFLYSDLGDVLVDEEEKLKVWSQAAVLPGKMEMKINLFKKIAELIENQTDLKDKYKQHLLLMARISLEQGWNITQELDALLTKNNIDVNEVDRAREAYNKLIPFWKDKAQLDEQEQTGSILFLHKNGKSGMIKGKDGKDYFFSMHQIRGNKEHAVKGATYKFTIQDSFDRKKNRASKMAVNLIKIS